MADELKALGIRSVRERVRESLQHAPMFRLDLDLPDLVREKVQELDRVAAPAANRAS